MYRRVAFQTTRMRSSSGGHTIASHAAGSAPGLASSSEESAARASPCVSTLPSAVRTPTWRGSSLRCSSRYAGLLPVLPLGVGDAPWILRALLRNQHRVRGGRIRSAEVDQRRRARTWAGMVRLDAERSTVGRKRLVGVASHDRHRPLRRQQARIVRANASPSSTSSSDSAHLLLRAWRFGGRKDDSYRAGIRRSARCAGGRSPSETARARPRTSLGRAALGPWGTAFANSLSAAGASPRASSILPRSTYAASSEGSCCSAFLSWIAAPARSLISKRRSASSKCRADLSVRCAAALVASVNATAAASAASNGALVLRFIGP